MMESASSDKEEEESAVQLLDTYADPTTEEVIISHDMSKYEKFTRFFGPGLLIATVYVVRRPTRRAAARPSPRLRTNVPVFGGRVVSHHMSWEDVRLQAVRSAAHCKDAPARG